MDAQQIDHLHLTFSKKRKKEKKERKKRKHNSQDQCNTSSYVNLEIYGFSMGLVLRVITMALFLIRI